MSNITQELKTISNACDLLDGCTDLVLISEQVQCIQSSSKDILVEYNSAKKDIRLKDNEISELENKVEELENKDPDLTISRLYDQQPHIEEGTLITSDNMLDTSVLQSFANMLYRLKSPQKAIAELDNIS